LDQYSVRRFRNGDEEEAARLFNERYAAYGGFVSRTAEYWLWSCLRRPDVKEDGVFFVCDDKIGRVCGYAVVGLTGNVWDFCAGSNDEEIVASMLLKEIVSYLESVGVSSVNINVPVGGVLGNVLVQEGFSRVPADRMFVTTLSLTALLSELCAGKEFERNEEIDFVLSNVPVGTEKAFSIRVHDGKVSVVEASHSSSIVVKMEYTTFLSVLFGGTNVHRELIVGRVWVRPFWKAIGVATFLNELRVRDEWFWPLSDFG
jgi:hypothetical protein